VHDEPESTDDGSGELIPNEIRHSKRLDEAEVARCTVRALRVPGNYPGTVRGPFLDTVSVTGGTPFSLGNSLAMSTVTLGSPE
jgi:hypothetical protein